MKKITYKGKSFWIYSNEEHEKAVEAVGIAETVKDSKELLDSLETFFIEEVGIDG